MLRTLQDKGSVRSEAEGRAHRYFPTVSQDAAGKNALSRLLDKIFAGSPELLLTQLVSDRDIAPEELSRLRRLLDEKLVTAKKRPRRR